MLHFLAAEKPKEVSAIASKNDLQNHTHCSRNDRDLMRSVEFGCPPGCFSVVDFGVQKQRDVTRKGRLCL